MTTHGVLDELSGLQLGAELGRGAATTVHRVLRDGVPYALKRPIEDAPGLLTAFRREAALLACVDDPGVPRIHAIGTHDGLPALVLGYLPGASLADLLADQPLPQARVVELAARMARALAAAHRTGLVHRDVKPANIMIGPDGSATLIDFGLALLRTGAEQVDEDAAVGTFRYASPEQSGMLERPVDGRSDLYSLGVVLFECLTGRLPFEADDVGQLLRLHLTAPVPDLSELVAGLDPALAAVVTRLLAKDPDDRYPDAAALLADLRACPGGAAAEEPAVVRWPLAGRDAERDLLTGRWRRAVAGQGGVARISGAAGSGRSRLADELALAADGYPVLRAGGHADDVLPLAALRAAVGGYLKSQRDQAERLVEEAARAAGPGAELLLGAVAGGEESDEQLFAEAAVFLGELATRAGAMMLVLDDAHWLDAGSRQVLTRLAANRRHLPLLVVLAEIEPETTAAEPGNEPAEPAVAADVEVACGPLDAEAIGALLASRLPGTAIPAELTRHVAARTDGTPLTVVEYLLRLLDAGLLTPNWGAWHFDETGADALPAAPDVRALLTDRLALLTEADRRVLVTAAVAGRRFRPGTLTAAGNPADQVAVAVSAAVTRRVLESRTDGWYVFVHPVLRDALLDGIPDEQICRLHAALADALDSLPEDARDADHVYAVARHLRAAADAAPAERRHSGALAAGLRALDDRAPAEAADYLEDALAADPASAEVLQPLAVAYLRAGRLADARATIDRAVAAEPDRHARARLLVTAIEIHHTLWDDDRAQEATARAVAELRRPLPRNGLLALPVALAAAGAGGVVRRTRWGSGSARGRRRDDLAVLAAALDSGGYAAAIGLRLQDAGVLSLRAMYAVNRLGPCPEYVRVYAMAGYVAAVLKLRGTAERCLKRAAGVAADLGDPALIAYVEWIRGSAMLFGGYDDGTTWLAAITKHSRWYGPAQYISGHFTRGLRLLLAGHIADSRAEYERALNRLPDPDTAKVTMLGMLSVMIPAISGQPGRAAAALADLRAAVTDGSTAQRANVVVAATCAVLEEGEFGEPFERSLAEFRALGLRRHELMTAHKWFYVFQAYGRLAQVRLAPEQERPARYAAARTAVAELRRVRHATPLINATYLVCEAGLATMRGDHERALGWTDKAERAVRAVDAPLMHFEIARMRARIYRGMDLPHEMRRHTRIAYDLAERAGLDSRRRKVRAEFGVDDAGSARLLTTGTLGSGRNRQLEALQQVSTAAATVLDPQQLAGVALDETLRILGAERALFFLLDEAGNPVPYAGRGTSGEDLTATTTYGASLVRQVAETHEALVVTSTEQGAALGSQSTVAYGLRSVLVAPVRFKGAMLGVVYLDSRLARGIFTDDDVDVLTAVTSHVAVSLETARAAQLHLAVQAAQQQQAFSEMLRAGLAELSALQDPGQVLRALFAMLVDRVGAEAGCLVTDTVIEVAGTADPALLGGPPAGDFELRVPLVSQEGHVGEVLLSAGSFDDTARQVAAALVAQGMSAYDNARLFSRVQELATTDELTGLHNRRHFYALAGALIEAAARGSRGFAAAMLDIDKFKSINDTYGHGVGDEVIRTVAARVGAVIRTSDVLGRYGGEEFALVLPDHEGLAASLAERIRAAVAASPVPTAAGPIPVTVSVGLAELDGADCLDQVLARADHALYRAKEGGRNRVAIS
ncbi:diguanylate cyclase [Actinoplanes sp. NBC_00393]|uniref:diguanylate cyclase n=1 Tax=Actinoplanes sp. NBC_00393 TaxID=2975953 RepID=UPI002E23FF16